MNSVCRYRGLNGPTGILAILGAILVSLLGLRLDAQPGEIERQPVQSTVLASVGYHPAKRLLEIEFHSGAIYRYRNVPGEIHRRLLAAESKGHFFGAAIRDKFRCELVKARTDK